MNYKGYIIKPHDYPHHGYRYQFFHKDETDGNFDEAKSIEDALIKIDDLIDES